MGCQDEEWGAYKTALDKSSNERVRLPDKNRCKPCHITAQKGFSLMEWDDIVDRYHDKKTNVFKDMFLKARTIVMGGERKFKDEGCSELEFVAHDIYVIFLLLTVPELIAFFEKDPAHFPRIRVSKLKSVEGTPLPCIIFQDTMDPRFTQCLRMKVYYCKRQEFNHVHMRLTDMVREGQGKDSFDWLRRSAVERRPHNMRQGRQATNIFNKRGWDTTRRDYSRFGGHLALNQSWPWP